MKKLPADTPRTNAVENSMTGPCVDNWHVEDALKIARELERENNAMIQELNNIHDTAHCISKAGPLHTKTWGDVWAKFDRIAVMAVAARPKKPTKFP